MADGARRVAAPRADEPWPGRALGAPRFADSAVADLGGSRGTRWHAPWGSNPVLLRARQKRPLRARSLSLCPAPTSAHWSQIPGPGGCCSVGSRTPFLHPGAPGKDGCGCPLLSFLPGDSVFQGTLQLFLSDPPRPPNPAGPGARPCAPGARWGGGHPRLVKFPVWDSPKDRQTHATNRLGFTEAATSFPACRALFVAFWVCFGGTPGAVLRVHVWLWTQGTLWGAGDRTQVCCVRGRRTSFLYHVLSLQL